MLYSATLADRFDNISESNFYINAQNKQQAAWNLDDWISSLNAEEIKYFFSNLERQSIYIKDIIPVKMNNYGIIVTPR